MKKTLLTLMLASMLAFTARGQVLQNTWWRHYNYNNMFDYYFHFGQDTASWSYNNIQYTPMWVYSTAGSIITMTAVPPSLCATTDTGRYNFIISNDTLRLIIISDMCWQRPDGIYNCYYIRIPTGISDINPISPATISPNPSPDGIFNLSFTGNNNMSKRIYVLAADGRKIMDENFSSAEKNHIINLQSCASGIYFLVMENETGRRVMKLVK